MIYRGKIGQIVYEFLPTNAQCVGTLILCDGLPSVPKQKILMESLASAGFFVVFPRYRGTWESGGEFLKKSPVQDILKIIREVKTGYLVDLFNKEKIRIPSKRIVVLGSSFGGSVALALADNDSVAKIVALSPIVDFVQHGNKKEQNLIKLGSFIKTAFGESYRFSISSWRKLVQGRILNPSRISSNKKENVLICFDSSDSEIDARKIEGFVKENGVASLRSDGLGHLSFSKIQSSKMLSQISEWLKK